MAGAIPNSNSSGKPVPESRPASAPREITSAEILRGAKEVLIRHGEETYRLILTRNDKLILHK